jgi:hypothetical protein
MDELNDAFFLKLAEKLKSLPSLSDKEYNGRKIKREDCMMTSGQIRTWSQTVLTTDEIEHALWDRWQHKELKSIRPAKYPHQNELVSLWGHVDNMHRLDRPNLDPYREEEVLQLEQVDLPADAPQVFVSFSRGDLNLVLQLRQELARKGFRTWIYVNQIEKGAMIFDEVRSGISNCFSAIGLFTYVSIGSAWVYSELQSVKKTGRPAFALFHAKDKKLMRLIESWSPNPDPANRFDPKYDPDLILPLVRKYLRKGSGHHEAGYRNGVNNLLKSLSGYSCQVLFKKRPKRWNGYQRIIDFASFMNELPIIALKESVRQQQQIIEDQNKKIETQAEQIKKISEEIRSLTRQLNSNP